MLSFDIGDHRFQLRAAAVIVEDGYALLHRLQGDAIWALPGGRVEPGEAAASTVVREMWEETGEHLECGELVFVVENFFEHHGKKNHEVGLYFRSALGPESRLRGKAISHRGIESDRTLEFRWFRLDELGNVNLHPAFLRSALAALPGVASHVVQGKESAPWPVASANGYAAR